jgi:hypothetical protein
MLVVILCTVWQSFSWCFSNVGIHMTFYIEPFIPIHFASINTQGKLWGHTKFWYPSRDWLGWRCSSEDPYTSGLWQVCYSSGRQEGLSCSHISLTPGKPWRVSIRINLRDLAWSQVFPRDPGLFSPGSLGPGGPGTTPGIPSKGTITVFRRKDIVSRTLTVPHALIFVCPFSFLFSTTKDTTHCDTLPGCGEWTFSQCIVYVNLHRSRNPISNISETNSRGRFARPPQNETTDPTILGRRVHVNTMIESTVMIATATPPSPTPWDIEKNRLPFTRMYTQVPGIGTSATIPSRSTGTVSEGNQAGLPPNRPMSHRLARLRGGNTPTKGSKTLWTGIHTLHP